VCRMKYDPKSDTEVVAQGCGSCQCPTSGVSHNWVKEDGKWVCTKGNHGK
jgi:hypothetical protein